MEPHASRPDMPGYGIVGAHEGSGLLDWSWARERLEHSRDYWVATVAPGPGPHLMPVWGVLLDECLWWSTGPASRKARNIEANPTVAIATSDPSQPVVVEGTASLVSEPALVARFAVAMRRKYDHDPGLEFYAANATFRVQPARVFGLDTGDFTGSPTRWIFPADGR